MNKLHFCALLWMFSAAVVQAQPKQARPEPFSLDALEYRTFRYFWETTDTFNWQVPDRYPNLTFSSIAATGFGLTGYIIGAERGWITRKQAAERVLKTLAVLQNLPQGPEAAGVSGYKGFYYHFLDNDRARRFKTVELSTIDSGLLLAGILCCQSYFDADDPIEKDIRDIADFIYRRVEWTWMMNSNGRMSMGWHPESGFIASEWYGYNEAMILYVLALGSPTHPIDGMAWQKWVDTYYWDEFMGQEHVNFGPLFGHQYSHCWIDFRGIADPYMRSKGIDYFENSRRATLANHAYCVQNPGKFPGYSDKIWGLTASDGPKDWLHKYDPQGKCREAWDGPFEGYNARGVASDYLRDDGTIVPTAAGGSLPFAPEICLPTLQAMWEMYYDSLVGPYGFKDAFNPGFTACDRLPQGWFDPDYLGIDQGPILIMIENYRSGLIWKLMQKNPYIVTGLKRAGFTGGWIDKAPLQQQTLPPKAGRRSGKNPDAVSDPYARFERYNFRNGKGSALPYRLLRAEPVKPLEPGPVKYPLVIFLHGSGECGKDNEAQLKNGILGLMEGDRRERFNCYILAPQCPENQSWAPEEWNGSILQFGAEPTKAGRDLEALIQEYRKDPSIDTSRIYITGLSMGAYGAYYLLQRHPDWFAGALILCGEVDLQTVQQYKSVPIWIFQGQFDNVVPVARARQMVAALEAAGGKPRYTEYFTLGHAIWQETFYDEKVIEWLFQQKRP